MRVRLWRIVSSLAELPSGTRTGNVNLIALQTLRGSQLRFFRARQTQTDKECSEERLREAMFVKLEWAFVSQLAATESLLSRLGRSIGCQVFHTRTFFGFTSASQDSFHWFYRSSLNLITFKSATVVGASKFVPELHL